jgi:uncharacterized membrane protein/protein-disulfide isomerase
MSLNLSHHVLQWVNALELKISKKLLQQRLETHPDYPSILSITDTLTSFGVESLALQVSKENVGQLPLPFLAYMDSEGGNFRLVNDRAVIDNDHTDFYPHFTGIAVVAEKSVYYTDEENRQWLAKESLQKYFWAGLIGLITAASVVELLSSFSVLLMMLLSTGLSGIAIAAAIVMEYLGIENSFSKAFCAQDGKTDCNTIIRSKESRLLTSVAWSDVGIIFFSAQWLVIAMAGINDTVTPTVALLKIMAVGGAAFIPYSIYYQWRVAKKWCTLCLITIGMLALQAATFLIFQPRWFSAITLTSAMAVLFTFTITATGWFLLKEVLTEKRIVRRQLFNQQRFKQNAPLFLSQLYKSTKVDAIPFKQELELCSHHSPVQIIVACNPYCAPCAKMHELLHTLAERHPGQVGIAVRLVVPVTDKEDQRTRAAEYLLQIIAEKKNGKAAGEQFATTREILKDWFSNMDLSAFAAKYPLQKKQAVTGSLQQHGQWASEHKIEFTPTIFINGFQYPDLYASEDLPALVRGMLSEIEITNLQPAV